MQGQVLELIQMKGDAAWTAGSSGRVRKTKRRDLLIDRMCEKGKSRADSRCGARTTGRMEIEETNFSRYEAALLSLIVKIFYERKIHFYLV